MGTNFFNRNDAGVFSTGEAGIFSVVNFYYRSDGIVGEF